MTIKEFINLIAPTHGRTTCDDNNINNGFYSRNKKGYGRCYRCNLLCIEKGKPIPEELKKELLEGDYSVFWG